MIFDYSYCVGNKFPIRVILGVKIAEYPERNISSVSRSLDSNF
jgi:hypothetical protein